MSKGYVYKITNMVNDKVYIGITRTNQNERFLQHIKESNQEENKNRKLYSAFKEFGVYSFKIEILEEVKENTLKEREKYYIKLYNSIEKGYNMTNGGEGCRIIPYTDEQIIKQYYKSQCSTCKTAGILGISEYSVRNILDKWGIQRGNKVVNSIKQGVKVKQYTKLGEYIKTFVCLREAAREVTGNEKNAYRISCVAKGKEKSAFGYLWELEDKNKTEKNQRNNIVRTGGIPVEQIDITSNKILDIFDSMHAAARYIIEEGLSKASISSVSTKISYAIKNNYNAFGYKWAKVKQL